MIEAAEERQKSESSVNGGDGIRGLEDFERDLIAEVFGDDGRRSYCHAISSTSNAKQVKLMQASKVIVNYRESVNQKWREEMQTDMKTMSSAIVDLKQCMAFLVNQFGGNATTPTPVDTSNNEQNLNNSISSKSAPLDKVTVSPTGGKQSVTILGPGSVEVARGHIGTQKMCHGRKVVEGEQVVWVEDVLDPDASLFDAPQNGHYKLSELVDGGFVIWPEYRLRYQ